MALNFAYFVLFLAGVLVVPALSDDDAVPNCYKISCPAKTSACEKITTMSEDKKYFIIEIHCLDQEGKKLKNVTQKEKNTFGSNLNFEGYSFSGVFHFDESDEDNSTKKPETLITSAPNKDKTGKPADPNSEVEDLLSK